MAYMPYHTTGIIFGRAHHRSFDRFTEKVIGHLENQ